MLSRNDSVILGQQVDVAKALDLLAMFKEAGKERIDIRTILDEAAPKIKDYFCTRGQAGAALRQTHNLQYHGIRQLDEGKPADGV